MAARSSIYKYDVMKVLLLGYLYFYIAYICPAKSSDLDTSWEISLENCSAYNIKLKTCTCWKNYLDRCVICCSGISCCSCYDCTLCWEMQQRFTTITQMSIFMLFGFGLIGLILIYCKICHRSRQRTRSIALQEERDTQCSTIEDLRDRPPPYNEMAYNAPPLYTSPYNRASMQEAPPSYPGTPKLQERSQDTNDQFSSRNSTFVASSIAQHI
ncbi:uncharacterized protein LOC115239084 isoform X1 [Formica exsecta]|uniref:uncharacterized protein LOC115239084 isoform X1 n=1 Tax=Formica exsecta TaxID=72781 RepID=UPI0011423EA6|nr:uncharacterized protein LOC115239084 isoform X1 [Formica exsecta]